MNDLWHTLFEAMVSRYKQKEIFQLMWEIEKGEVNKESLSEESHLSETLPAA